MSGSTPWVKVRHEGRDALMAVVHTRNARRQYDNFVVLAEAEPPFRITYASERTLPLRCTPRVPKPWTRSRVCFPVGLLVTDHTVFLSYGAGDNEPWLWMIDRLIFGSMFLL